MLSEVIFSANGPIASGQQIPFTSPVDGVPVLFYLSASGFTNDAPAMVSIQMAVDGADVASAQAFLNENGVYHSLVCFVTTTTMTYGKHTLTLQPTTNFASDANCWFNVTLVY